jgi:hypothetical protein
MLRNEESVGRIKLAARILIQVRCGGGQPIILSEIAQLRFLAESDEELRMPFEQLARIVLERESKRIGFDPVDGLRHSRRN